MIDKEFVQKCVDNFNMRIDMSKNEVGKEDGSFDFSIANLRESRECIDALQHIVNQMKQEEHDLIQDVYNKFKDKGYSHNIKFNG
jgi:hypothetical protein